MRNLTILSEKPSQAAAYASAFEQSTRKKGFYEVKEPIFEGNVYIGVASGKCGFTTVSIWYKSYETVRSHLKR